MDKQRTGGPLNEPAGSPPLTGVGRKSFMSSPRRDGTGQLLSAPFSGLLGA